MNVSLALLGVTVVAGLAQDPAPAPTAPDLIVVHQASELVSWCEAEARAHFVGRGATPYQWTASYHERGNVLHVAGRLRVDGDDIAVRCRIARGARLQHGIIEIDPAQDARAR